MRSRAHRIHRFGWRARLQNLRSGLLLGWRDCLRLHHLLARRASSLLSALFAFGCRLHIVACPRVQMTVCAIGGAGFFQPDAGQFGCISCDSLGNFFQELQEQTSCQSCAAGTQRYVGVLSALNRSSCQCKEGARACAICSHASSGRRWPSPLRVCAGYYTRNLQSGEVRSAFVLVCVA